MRRVLHGRKTSPSYYLAKTLVYISIYLVTAVFTSRAVISLDCGASHSRGVDQQAGNNRKVIQ
jgi:hypothetical protein